MEQRDYVQKGIMVYNHIMNRIDWLNKWKRQRAKLLVQHKAGQSWNELAKKYGISVGAIGKKLKKAMQEDI